jgi:ribosomal protein L31
MSKENTNEQESLNADQYNDDFENAWDEDEAQSSETADEDDGDDEQDTDSDDNADEDESDDDQGDNTDTDADTDDESAGDDDSGKEGDEALDPKDEQREKSWAGRLEKREADLAEKERKFQAKQEERRTKIRELMKSDDNETDWETLSKAAEELDMPEFAVLANKVQKLEEAQRTQFESAQAQSEFETESTKVRTENKDYRTHVETISAKHPGFFNTVNTPEFNNYLNTLDPIARTGADTVLKKGNSSQVIALLDGFKGAHSKPEPKPTESDPAASLSTIRRGASKPRSEVDMNDFDAGWDED